ncbi:AraC family transcriptional regulator [Saccharibacillus brassicae]|uniref:Helix-turn-helix domain-containing protein n=1 Tax=Saccharibacillus brassicae TaxID=2583377 RepID=A0A4Y6UY59_SACBS|nr:AraC family transcriptional regulator [Saccharibacillus brassicae]QDH21458.1 helix-turn-helix domain-containing protein [Saccharibacillus brassicae]
MKRFPMTLQLACILFIVMVIPASILTWYSGEQSLRSSQREVAESSLAELVASRRLNESALNSLSQDTVRLSATGTFDRIRAFPTYDALSADYGNISRAMAVMRELTNLNRRAEGVYSSFFYLEDSDYVVSTDRSITRLSRYEPLDWIEQALKDQQGIGGVWYPRTLASGVPVVSYVLPLSRLSTTTRGTIVVNLRESQLENYLSSSNAANTDYALIDAAGTVVSHGDKSRLLTDASGLPFYGELAGEAAREGYAFRQTAGGERVLYAWTQSEPFGWTHLSTYSVQEMLTRTHAQQRGIILLTVVVIFVGTFATLFLAAWLSRPARELVRKFNLRGYLDIPGQNEFAFLDTAFRRMQGEESKLHELLRERERDTRSLTVQRLLRGEAHGPLGDLFPYPHFLVASISIDGYRGYVSKHNSETRSYHRHLLSTACDGLFEQGPAAYFLYRGDGYFALVVNDRAKEGDERHAELHARLEQVQRQASELLGHTVTIGVSRWAEGSARVPDLAAEALEALKRRMIAGSEGIHYGCAQGRPDPKYMYPECSERRILNFLDEGDAGRVQGELERIAQEIRAAEYVSHDNILFIYNQLVGVTIKHLQENGSQAARIVAGRGSVYSTIASFDTLDDLQAYVRGFYEDILSAQKRPEADTGSHGERIAEYLRAHCCEEVVFEDMAREIGISYSYMRKVVYEATGASLIDSLNKLRIEKAKPLLLEGERTITEIAAEVGYENARSFNRFFQKFEGLSPSAYKLKNRVS